MNSLKLLLIIVDKLSINVNSLAFYYYYFFFMTNIFVIITPIHLILNNSRSSL